MTKKFLKDNRGQVLYAVIVAIMGMSVLSMIAMGLTLKNYHSAAQKQQQVADYYAADAVAELIRIGEEGYVFESGDVTEAPNGVIVQKEGNTYTLTTATTKIVTMIENGKFLSWEVSYGTYPIEIPST